MFWFSRSAMPPKFHELAQYNFALFHQFKENLNFKKMLAMKKYGTSPTRYFSIEISYNIKSSVIVL